ncbi:MAG: class E sortase [bacterium]
MPKKISHHQAPAAQPVPRWWERRRAVQALFGFLLVLGLVLIGYPYLPLLTYTIAPPSVTRFPYATRLEVLPTQSQKPHEVGAQSHKLPPQGNRLVIPKIGVDIAVVEGTDDRVLARGAWRIPGTSSSPEKGNMVLSAHRFRYRPPSSETFYLLDKVKPDDTVILYWKNVEYDYRVTITKEVKPDAVEILQQTLTPTLTLFTCAPLFSTARRLVVVAEPL